MYYAVLYSAMLCYKHPWSVFKMTSTNVVSYTRLWIWLRANEATSGQLWCQPSWIYIICLLTTRLIGRRVGRTQWRNIIRRTIKLGWPWTLWWRQCIFPKDTAINKSTLWSGPWYYRLVCRAFIIWGDDGVRTRGLLHTNLYRWATSLPLK